MKIDERVRISSEPDTSLVRVDVNVGRESEFWIHIGRLRSQKKADRRAAHIRTAMQLYGEDVWKRCEFIAADVSLSSAEVLILIRELEL